MSPKDKNFFSTIVILLFALCLGLGIFIKKIGNPEPKLLFSGSCLEYQENSLVDRALYTPNTKVTLSTEPVQENLLVLETRADEFILNSRYFSEPVRTFDFESVKEQEVVHLTTLNKDIIINSTLNSTSKALLAASNVTSACLVSEEKIENTFRATYQLFYKICGSNMCTKSIQDVEFVLYPDGRLDLANNKVKSITYTEK